MGYCLLASKLVLEPCLIISSLLKVVVSEQEQDPIYLDLFRQVTIERMVYIWLVGHSEAHYKTHHLG